MDCGRWCRDDAGASSVAKFATVRPWLLVRETEVCLVALAMTRMSSTSVGSFC